MNRPPAAGPAGPGARFYGASARSRGPRYAAAPGPGGGPRLLADWYDTGRPTCLARHLERYGPAPLPGPGGGGDGLIDAVEQAGLTGRGGAAFPTGRKMRAVARGRGPAVVVANGMESEPASFKDRTLLGLAPHLVLDGIALAAAAVGAGEAYLCLARGRERLSEDLGAAVRERRRAGLDPVRVRVCELPHHYVSSEESSLVRWLNGGEARPASVPPRPFERGVGGRASLVGNVETLAHVALIARYGPDWFRREGVRDAPGTALVTLSAGPGGPGVHEVALGTALREVMALAPHAPASQAVLVGGFFGSWLSAGQVASVRYSAPAIRAAGGGIGAGVIVALPEAACGLAETARVLRFLAGASAGQCGPCRLGLPAVAQDFADLAWGRAAARDGRRLWERIGLLAGRGACKHPDGASRLAASALRVFGEDARRHLAAGPCAAAGHGGAGVLQVPDTAPIAPGDWL